jgi:hypothetical protein
MTADNCTRDSGQESTECWNCGVSLEKYEPREIEEVPHCGVCEVPRPADRASADGRPEANALVEVGAGWGRASLRARSAFTSKGWPMVVVEIDMADAAIELEMPPVDAQEFVDELTEALEEG